MTNDAWPTLPYAEWAATKKTLHLCAQMLGKARLALAPFTARSHSDLVTLATRWH